MVLGLVSCGLGEILLRAFWRNPGIYPWNDYLSFVRLLSPNQDESYDITGLYAGAGKIRFRTGPFGQVLNLGLPGSSWAIGGSTTECRYVAECRRWPDRIAAKRVTNFGSSGCALGDLYFNLRFLLSSQPAAPETIILMEAVNDLSSWKDYLESRGELQAWARLRARFHTTPQDLRSAWGRKVWLIGWYTSIRNRYPLRNFAAWSARDFYKRVRAKSEAGRAENPLSRHDFESFELGPFQEVLRYREKVFLEFKQLVFSCGAELILLTQPNSFRKDYQPFAGIDLRDTPELMSGFASYEQTALLLRKINQQTRQWCKEYGLRLVDAEKSFDQANPSNLFYDSVHYTEKGAEKLAHQIDQDLASK